MARHYLLLQIQLMLIVLYDQTDCNSIIWSVIEKTVFNHIYNKNNGDKII